MPTALEAPSTTPSLDTSVTVLCADWCRHCRSFRDEIAGHTGSALVWLDVEDQNIDVDALSITAFPTVAVFHPRGVLRYLGPVKPYRHDLNTCIDQALRADPMDVPAALASATREP